MARSTIAVAMSIPPSSALSSSSSSSNPTVRFLGQLRHPEQPDINNSALEFHESDVVWPSSSSDSPSPSHASSSPPINRQYRRQQKSGLYAALSDDQQPLVRRKSTMSPTLSATRTIPPVALMRAPDSSKYHQSAPVNVPTWSKKPRNNLGHFDEVVDDVVEEEEEMIPPHEIVARTYVTFSVFEGAGRTLKGRDLRRVRNAVFQKTGFLD